MNKEEILAEMILINDKMKIIEKEVPNLSEEDREWLHQQSLSLFEVEEREVELLDLESQLINSQGPGDHLVIVK